MNLDRFKTVEQLATAIKTLIGTTTDIPAYVDAKLTAAPSATDTTIDVNRLPTGVINEGFYVVIDPWTVQCEIRKVTSISSNTLTIAALSFAHAVDDGVIYTTEPVANVKWFGALGDNSTDDYAAIQAAIDEAELAEIDTVFVPNGDYKIGTGLIIDHYCHFTGVGVESNIIGTANITLIQMKDDSEVSYLRLQGNDRTNSASIGIEIGGDSGVSTNIQAVIKDIRFATGFYYGIYSDFEVDRAVIENVQMFSPVTKGGIYLAWDGATGAKTANATIKRCALAPTLTIIGEVNYGIYARGFDALLLEQNTINSWDNCIYIDGDATRGIWGLRILGLHSEERRTDIYNGTRWTATTAVSQNDIILPTKAKATGFVYKAQGNGTTGGTEPTWPTTYGGTVVDNTVTWEAVATSHAIYLGSHIREGAISDVYAIDHIYGLVDNSTAKIDAYDLHVTNNDFSFIRQSGGPSYWAIRGSAFDGNYKPYISSYGSATDSLIVFTNVNWSNNTLSHEPTLGDMLVQQIEFKVSDKSTLNRADIGTPGTGVSAGGQLFASGDMRTEGGLSVGSSSNNAATGAIWATGDIFNTAWTDYSGTSTVTGWSSFTTKEISYKRVGNLVFVKFRLIGTSNATNANFTLPITGEGDYNGACWGRDNTGTRAPTLFFIDGSVPDVDIWWGGSATGFTASGTKECAGEFWYEAA